MRLPEEFGVGGLGEDFLHGLADLADGAPAALEAVDPRLAGVVEAALDAIAEALVLAGGGRHALLLLLQGQVEELARLVLHSVHDLGGDAVVDHLHEPPLGECRHQQLRGPLAVRGVVRVQPGQVHGGQLLRHVEVVVQHRRPLVLRPDEFRQVGARAAQQVGLPRLRPQARVVVALPAVQPISRWHMPEMVAPHRPVHERLVVRRVQRLRDRHAGPQPEDSIPHSLPQSSNLYCITSSQKPSSSPPPSCTKSPNSPLT